MAPVILWLEIIKDPLLQSVIVDSCPVQWMSFNPGTPGFGDIHETGRAPKKEEFSNVNPIDAYTIFGKSSSFAGNACISKCPV